MRETIERERTQFKTLALARAAEQLDIAERAGVPPRMDAAVARSAYRLTREPARFAALWAASRELGFEPATWLDLGAGPGTAAYLAEEFGALVTLVEPNPQWHDAARGRWVRAELHRLPPLDSHDVVSMYHVLKDLTEDDGARLLVEAWQLAGRALLLVEPGSSEGFARIRRAREQLIALGAQIQAPCPHAGACPVEAPDWCHFAVRVGRTRAEHLQPGTAHGYQDQQFCYLLAVKRDAAPCRARVVRNPRRQPKFIQLRVCDGEKGLLELGITKKNQALWPAARRTLWGARFTPGSYDEVKSAEGDASQAE